MYTLYNIYRMYVCIERERDYEYISRYTYKDIFHTGRYHSYIQAGGREPGDVRRDGEGDREGDVEGAVDKHK